MSQGPHSLSPAQIQFLKIGPKAGTSEESKKQLVKALNIQKNKFFAGDTTATSSLNKIPKITYGEFEKTVNNFGVLINKNFGNETSLHQSQKFGKLALQVNKVMIQQKDKPIYSQKKNALLKKLKDRSDNRTTLKAVYDYQGKKLFVVLKSFTLDTDKSTETGLPIPYLRFLINHINSSRLAKILQPSLKSQGNQIVVQFDKIQGRASHLSNSEAKYQNIEYSFERFGQTMMVNLPMVEFSHVESKFTQSVQILNKQILEIIDTSFDNITDIVQKYLDTQGFKSALQGQNNQMDEKSEEQEQEK